MLVQAELAPTKPTRSPDSALFLFLHDNPFPAQQLAFLPLPLGPFFFLMDSTRNRPRHYYLLASAFPPFPGHQTFLSSSSLAAMKFQANAELRRPLTAPSNGRLDRKKRNPVADSNTLRLIRVWCAWSRPRRGGRPFNSMLANTVHKCSSCWLLSAKARAKWPARAKWSAPVVHSRNHVRPFVC